MLKIGFGLMESPWYWLFILGCFLIALLIWFFQPFIIGWFGEHWTRENLKKLNKNKYKVINNLFFEVNGTYHQIDHVVVSRYGIFCIETKQYNGYITGGEWDKKWVRHAKNKKYYYTNPVRQNYGHIVALSQLLNINKNVIINVVCLPGDDKARTIKVERSEKIVRYYELEYKILNYLKPTIENPDKVYEFLLKCNNKNLLLRRKYYKSLKKRDKEDLNDCPMCGGKLVKRNSQYGEFWGCSNYPKCKYKRNNN